MFTFKEGMTLAREFDMIPQDPYWPEDGNTWTFTEKKMVDSCWLTHTFAFAESVQDCIKIKMEVHSAGKQ